MAKNIQPINRVKSPATIEDQIKKLESRGCVVEDREHAVRALTCINYYRLVHYFAVFLETKSQYKEGTSFEKVMHIYDFDRSMRSILIAALEEIEIAFRAHISNYHAMKYGALGYLNDAGFDNARHNHKQFLRKIDRIIETNTGEKLVTHHISKYGGAFPLWVLMELFSFGTLNNFYSDMITDDKRNIAEKAFGLSYRCVENWMQLLSDLRNHCAHYNRLYANDTFETPKQPPETEREIGNTLFDYLIIIKRLYPRPADWNSLFAARLENLLDEYKEHVELKYIGFPDDWREYLMNP